MSNTHPHAQSHTDSRHTVEQTESRSDAQNFLSALQQYIDQNTTTEPEENRYSPPPIGAPQDHITANATVPSVMGFFGADQARSDALAASSMCEEIEDSLGEALDHQFQSGDDREAWKDQVRKAFQARLAELRQERENKLADFIKNAGSTKARHTAEDIYTMSINELLRHYRVLRDARAAEKQLLATNGANRNAQQWALHNNKLEAAQQQQKAALRALTTMYEDSVDSKSTGVRPAIKVDDWTDTDAVEIVQKIQQFFRYNSTEYYALRPTVERLCQGYDPGEDVWWSPPKVTNNYEGIPDEIKEVYHRQNVKFYQDLWLQIGRAKMESLEVTFWSGLHRNEECRADKEDGLNALKCLLARHGHSDASRRRQIEAEFSDTATKMASEAPPVVLNKLHPLLAQCSRLRIKLKAAATILPMYHALVARDEAFRHDLERFRFGGDDPDNCTSTMVDFFAAIQRTCNELEANNVQLRPITINNVHKTNTQACFNCGEVGHWKWECPKPPAENGGKGKGGKGKGGKGKGGKGKGGKGKGGKGKGGKGRGGKGKGGGDQDQSGARPCQKVGCPNSYPKGEGFLPVCTSCYRAAMESQEPIKTKKNAVITVPKKGSSDRKNVNQATKKGKRGTKRKAAEVDGDEDDEQEGILHGGNISVIQGREPKRFEDIMRSDADEVDYEDQA